MIQLYFPEIMRFVIRNMIIENIHSDLVHTKHGTGMNTRSTKSQFHISSFAEFNEERPWIPLPPITTHPKWQWQTHGIFVKDIPFYLIQFSSFKTFCCCYVIWLMSQANDGFQRLRFQGPKKKTTFKGQDYQNSYTCNFPFMTFWKAEPGEYGREHS